MKKLKNVWYYIQGWYRYHLYYNGRLAFLIPKHIREQIEARINSMDYTCYAQGYCKICECSTTALQMCNKPCDKPCYPRLLSKQEWQDMKDFEWNEQEGFYYNSGLKQFIKRKAFYKNEKLGK